MGFSSLMLLWTLDPLGTTGRICLQSPVKIIHVPQNGGSDLVISLSHNAIDSYIDITHYLPLPVVDRKLFIET